MYRALLCITLLLPALPANAAWQVVNGLSLDARHKVRAARIQNSDGYRLEVYRGADGSIRSRFLLRKGFEQFAPRSCPTFQVDGRKPVNASIDDQACTTDKRWAEFVLGYVKGRWVNSSTLYGLMSGNTVTYRFALAHGGYRQTRFSLKGSNHAIHEALNGLRVRRRQ